MWIFARTLCKWMALTKVMVGIRPVQSSRCEEHLPQKHAAKGRQGIFCTFSSMGSFLPLTDSDLVQFTAKLPNFYISFFDSFRRQMWFFLTVYQLHFCWHLYCKCYQRKGKASILLALPALYETKILRQPNIISRVGTKNDMFKQGRGEYIFISNFGSA